LNDSNAKISKGATRMKLQLGLLYRDRANAAYSDCLSILGEFADSRAETAGQFVDGPLALAYRGDRITPEEEYETQPLQYGPLVLTFDGRLDNRNEIASRLGLVCWRSTPDPVLVAKAYEQFGDPIFPDLIGEFAFALWCRSTRSLRFVRSVCGSRPLYYVLEKKRLVWSSDFSHLVRISGTDLAIDESYAVRYLISDPDPTATPLKNLRAVAPGSAMCFQGDLFSSHQSLWNPRGLKPLYYRKEEEYEEHCREVLTQAVRVRLRAKRTVFSELSGGFDSSSIVLIADKILQQQDQDTATLQTVSCIYGESQTCDERSFIRTIEEWRKRETLLVHEQEQKITLGLIDPEFTGLPSPLHCFPGRYSRFSALMRGNGAKVLLTGLGGDHLFWSSCDGAVLVADQLRTRKIGEAHKLCWTWSRKTGLPYLQLLRRVLTLCLGSQYLALKTPPWLASDQQARIQGEIRFAHNSIQHDLLPSQRAQLRLVEHLFTVISAGYLNEYRDLYITHPFTHRPLVEFCLSVPISQLVHNGEMRYLMRRALRNVLPPKLLRRRSKGMVDEALIRALQREWPTIQEPDKWQVCQRGFVNTDALRESLRKMSLGLQLPEEPLIRVFTLERWLRSLERLRMNTGPDLLRQTFEASRNARGA
jgi:asparagine synthase (glutamine-hydrolysing)